MKYLVIAITLTLSTLAFSYDYDFGKKGNAQKHVNKSGCSPSSTTLRIKYNDVSALLETGGMLFLDRSTGVGTYEVPKNTGLTAIYAASLWMGGVDVNNQLKIAAQKYRSSGNDFWTGPLTSSAGTGNYDPKNPLGDKAFKDYGDANIGKEECEAYDKFFTIRKAEVIQFSTWWDACKGLKSNTELCAAVPAPSNEVLNRIYAWPAHGDETLNQDHYLAPFYDNAECQDGKDGWYDPLNDGDYPWYDDILKKDDIVCGSDRRISLFGDETNWWIFNDKGNIHTETGGDPIGMEIRAQAFTFTTTDQINRMTFYNYEMINRGTQTLYNTYFAQYVDPDLGNYSDDYVGCDVTRGLGYCYNADENDEPFAGKLGYGTNPPAIGVDYFEGPYQDADTIDNPGPHFDNQGKLVKPTVLDAIKNKGIVYAGLGIGYGDGIVDNERYGMKRFTYYTGSGASNQSVADPSTAGQYYNYMTGKWRFGDKTMFGGSGFPGADKVTTIPADYMFPGDSDTLNWSTAGTDPGKKDWSEISEKNPKGDRRFVQSAGPFTLKPGAINNITVGIVYARSTESGLLASVNSLRRADTKAQQLFDNCFKILEPPSAPKLSIQELDKELILTISNPTPSNNIGEKYIQKDYAIDPSYADKFYRFEGYMIYQAKSEKASASDLYNTDNARLVAQCDIKNGVSKVINYEFDEDFGISVPVLKVKGSDQGIKHSFAVSTDMFTNTKLTNNKTYYYIAVAYAYNNFKTYIPDEPGFTDGQKIPFIMSRTGYDGAAIKPMTGIPHKPLAENVIQKANFGYTPQITRLDGRGNGHRSVELIKTSFDEIVSKGKLANPTYDYGKGPLNIKVVDPLNLAKGYFECKFKNYKVSTIQSNESINNDGVDTASWVIYRYNSKDGGQLLDSALSENTIAVNNEQLIPKWGVSVQIVQAEAKSIDANMTTKYEYRKFAEPISATISFSDSSKKWLTFVRDNDQFNPSNWIRSGINEALAKDNDTKLGYNNPFLFPDASYGVDNSPQANEVWIDKEQKYPKLLSGGIAPHCLVGFQSEYMPIAYPTNLTSYRVDIRERASLIRTPSIDLVITSDTSKWTRCAVIELGRNSSLTEGGATAGMLRKGLSVDKMGNTIAGSTGMSWFPGYAIDVESGVRLHMAFGENSFLFKDNGRDMIWNPSNVLYDDNGQPHLGGQHPIYVFGNKVHSFTDNNRNCPYYDGTNNWVYDNFKSGDATSLVNAYTSLVWVVNPLLASNQTLLSSDLIIKTRLAKQYNDYTATGLNNGKPMYGWSMDQIATTVASQDVQKSALSLVNVVPNPYYAYSEYEKSRLDTRVKITNLPAKCNISIYNLSGKLVRSFKIDHTSDETEKRVYYIDWDMKNNQAIPIASGVYLIHVEVPGVGETIIKFFGGVRQIDLENI